MLVVLCYKLCVFFLPSASLVGFGFSGASLVNLLHHSCLLNLFLCCFFCSGAAVAVDVQRKLLAVCYLFHRSSAPECYQCPLNKADVSHKSTTALFCLIGFCCFSSTRVNAETGSLVLIHVLLHHFLKCTHRWIRVLEHPCRRFKGNTELPIELVNRKCLPIDRRFFRSREPLLHDEKHLVQGFFLCSYRCAPPASDLFFVVVVRISCALRKVTKSKTLLGAPAFK